MPRSQQIVAAPLAFIPAVSLTAGLALDGGWPFFWFSVAFALAQLVPVPTPSGSAASLVPAVAAAGAIATGGSPVVMLAGAGVALPVGWGASHVLRGRRAVDSMFPADHVGLVAFTGLYWLGVSLFPGIRPEDMAILGVLALAAVGWHGAASAARSWLSRQGASLPRRVSLRTALDDWPAYTAMFASAAMYAVTVDTLGLWSVPLAGMPFAFGYVALARLRTTRHTYGQTIRALGRIPEASGLVPDGHAGRTADLAVAVGAELGLSARAIQRVEEAALLHDIGRVVLSNPAVSAEEYSAGDVAGWSAAIISESSHLAAAADIVAVQHHPYRKPGQVRDTSVPAGSQIVRTMARFDSAVAGGLNAIEALELLHAGAAYDFDPDVVLALRRVLERRGDIAA